MPSSNTMYSLDKIIYEENNFKLVVIENEEIKVRTTCPAVIFAASRNLKVIGRTIILIDSISTRNGFSHIGALSGNRCAVADFIEYSILLAIHISHIGRPRVKVKIICLVVLNK